MPSWFKKVFQSDAATRSESAAADVKPLPRAPSLEHPALGKPDTAAYERPVVTVEPPSAWIGVRAGFGVPAAVVVEDRPAAVVVPGRVHAGVSAAVVVPTPSLSVNIGIGTPGVVVHDHVHVKHHKHKGWKGRGRGRW